VIKYGVVGADVLLRDLRGWDTLYIAGRLHKPVLHLARDAELAAAAEANLAAALAAGLLLLPARFSTEARRVPVCGAAPFCVAVPGYSLPRGNLPGRLSTEARRLRPRLSAWLCWIIGYRVTPLMAAARACTLSACLPYKPVA
jgi:hypothetical protein